MIRPVNGIVPIKLWENLTSSPYTEPNVGQGPIQFYIQAISFDDNPDLIPCPFNTWIVQRFDKQIVLYTPFGAALDAGIEIVTADDVEDDIRPVNLMESFVYNFRHDASTVIPAGDNRTWEVPFYYPITLGSYRITSYRPIQSLILWIPAIQTTALVTASVFTDDDINNALATFAGAIDVPPWVVSPRLINAFPASQMPIAAPWRLYQIKIENAGAVPLTVNGLSAWGIPC